MKYIFKTCLTALAALCFVSAGASAQSSFTITDEKPQSFDDAQLAYKLTMKIHNGTSTEKTLKVTEYPDEVMFQDDSYFCVGETCLPPNINEYQTFVGANESSDLYVYLKDKANVNGTRKVRYVFADADNPSDNIERTFTFVIGPTSVGEYSKGIVATLSSPTPNPAPETASIQYSTPEASQGSIELYSADSKLLKTFSLQNSSGALVIPTAEFPAGVYFYALVINGKKLAGDKLVITR